MPAIIRKQKRVGSVLRFDFETSLSATELGHAYLIVGEGAAQILDLYVVPEQRGLGYSKEMIATLRRIAQGRLGKGTIVAHVAEDNLPSLRAFASDGFDLKDHERHMERSL